MNLISDEYMRLNKTLHEEEESYGISARHHIVSIRTVLRDMGLKTILDYGCGKGLLRQKFGPMVREYDPAIEGKDSPPEPAELVCCIDVLEHIEPECLDDVLDHIKSLTETAAYFSIACGPAMKTLSDGRNAHLVQEPVRWWLPKLMERFDIHSFQSSEDRTQFKGLFLRREENG